MSKKVLIVDDDPVIRILVSEIVQSFGHSVTVLESGSSCLSELSKNLPDVLILDLQMPDMSGLDVLKQLKSDMRTSALPVLMLSANSDSEKLAEEEVKADQYLQKPFNLGEFKRALEKL